MDARYDFTIPTFMVLVEAVGMVVPYKLHAQAGLPYSSMNVASVINTAPRLLRACIIFSAFCALGRMFVVIMYLSVSFAYGSRSPFGMDLIFWDTVDVL